MKTKMYFFILTAFFVAGCGNNVIDTQKQDTEVIEETQNLGTDVVVPDIVNPNANNF